MDEDMTVNGRGGEAAKDPSAPANAATPSPAEIRVLTAGHADRPWLPAAVASVIAATLLLILLIPGVLRYPQPMPPPPPAEPVTRQARQDSNRALEERIASLRRLLDAGVCVADGSFRIPPGSPSASSLTPEDRASLPPPPANRTTVPETSGQPFNGSLLDLLDQSTVLVLQSDAGGQLVGSGSGFIVAPGQVLTNRHVTGDGAGRRIHVVNRTLGVVPAEIVAESPDGDPGSPDFALLRVERADRGVPLTLAPMAERLVNIVAAGFPSMVLATDERFRKLLAGESGEVPTASVTEGVVTAVQRGDGTDIILHTAQITPGNSGGPLVDRCGRIVGINTFIQAREEGRMNYALASPDVARFLAAHGVPAASAAGPCAPAASAAPPPGPAPAAPGAATPPAAGAAAQPAPPPRPGAAAGQGRGEKRE